MLDREQLYTGLSQAAWGYFLLLLNFNLNFNNTISINLLPSFAGALLLLSAINKLSAERRDLKLLRPLCILLVVWHLADWVLNLVGFSVSGHFLFLDLLVGVATLYFHFQFLTDMAALAEEYQPDDDNLAARIRSHRTAYTLLVTAIALLQSLAQAFPWEWWPGIAVFAAVIACIVALMIMADLFHLRRLVPKAEIGPR